MKGKNGVGVHLAGSIFVAKRAGNGINIITLKLKTINIRPRPRRQLARVL